MIKPFARSEYARRLAETRQRMEQAGFDLIICQDPANMAWLTGYDGWSFYVPQAVLVHQNEDEPIWFGRAQDARAAHYTTDLTDSNIVGFSEELVQHPVRHPFDELSALVKDRGWAKAKIGVELDAHYYTARCHDHLLRGLPHADISDCHELVNWTRLVKSKAELVYMKEAGEICTEVMRRALLKIEPGVPQYEVIAEVYHAQIMGANGNFGHYTGLCPLIQVGERTSTSHLTWTEEPLPSNGLLMMEIAGARHHYHAPLTRTMHIGPAPMEIQDLAKVIVEGVDVALEKSRPGVTCEEVESVWQQVLRRNGLRKDSRVGYSIGLNYPPDWGERTASFRPGDKTELQAGMCFHFQSGMWLDSYGAAISEPFVVTESGGERLCSVERELIIIN